MVKLFNRPWTKAGMRRALRKLDLQPIRRLLRQKMGWTAEQLDEAEPLYRGFLELMIDYPDQLFSPSEEIDAFWHMHMLDSRKYEQDCYRVFGRTIHHDPHLTVGSPSQEAAWENTRSKLEPVASARVDCVETVVTASPGSTFVSVEVEQSTTHGSSCGSSSGSSCGSSSGSSSCGGGGSSCGGGGD